MHVAIPVIALALVACDRGSSRDAPAPRPALPPDTARSADAATATSPSAAASPAPRAGCTLERYVYQRPQPKRVVAIGDVHGDLAATRAALRLAGAIDAKDTWIGKDLVVVQTGDVLDRGDDEQAIIDLVGKLERESRAAGGDFIMLLGNHELMNAAGDFRYVTPGAMTDFDDVPGLDDSKWPQVPARMRKRFAALAPGGPYAKKLGEHGVIVIVGDTVYSHAGVLGDWVTQVDAANESARCWLDGQAGGPDKPPAVLTSDDGPVWTRAVGQPDADCAAAKAALAALGAKRMIVGHTVQPHINSACDGTVWRIDVGLAKLYGGPIEVLELAAGQPPKVLAGKRD